MPVTTYLREDEHTKEVSNMNLQKLLDEVNLRCNNNYRLEEREIEVKRNLFRKIKEKTYSLYYKISGIEFQEINFYREKSNSSINLDLNADIVSAYFYGILNGDRK